MPKPNGTIAQCPPPKKKYATGWRMIRNDRCHIYNTLYICGHWQSASSPSRRHFQPPSAGGIDGPMPTIYTTTKKSLVFVSVTVSLILDSHVQYLILAEGGSGGRSNPPFCENLFLSVTFFRNHPRNPRCTPVIIYARTPLLKNLPYMLIQAQKCLSSLLTGYGK